MFKILIVDDESGIRLLIKKYAEFEGYEVSEAENGMDALEKIKLCSEQFDIIIMDVMMPELDGFSAAREIRKYSDIPILMLTARGEEYDRIHGFENGVDDYVVKPFSPKELMMRINAILKRTENNTRKTHILKFENLQINFEARTVILNNNRINLSPKEYDLLCYLVKNKNIALSREQILSNVWGYDYYGDDRTLDTHIKLLRKSLGAFSSHIVTVRGVGYRFE